MASKRLEEVRDYAFADQALALRKRTGLTQRELSDQLGVTTQSIHAWEGGLSYPGSERLRQLIAFYLERGVLEHGREIEEAKALWDTARARAPRRIEPFDPAWFPALPSAGAPSSRQPERPPTNLPPARTSFIGRGADVQHLTDALTRASRGATRLLTLTGIAGSGKTRLALTVGEAVLEAYPDGVWFVELASLPASSDPDPTPVALATLAALRLHEQPGQTPIESLVAYLAPRHLLLVLDNCEHVVAACASLTARLLLACPQLQIVTTSQYPLGIAQETLWHVETLSIPAAADDTGTGDLVDALRTSEAVQLFVERAQAARPGFELSLETAADSAAICRELDGLPLAIELAAARLNMLPVDEVLRRLTSRFTVLRRGGRIVADRHQTLQATMDWSYRLLELSDQAALRRLAVFSGGWDVAAAEAVCADELVSHESVLEALDELQARSLIHVSLVDSVPRYGMLETVRQYGLQQLHLTGEMAGVRDRHLEWCMRLAEQAAPALQGPEQEVWLVRLEREHDNLRAALRWSLGGEAAGSALRLTGALTRFWLMHAHFSEGRYWLSEALAAEGGTATERALALDGAGLLAEGQGAYEEATGMLEESLVLWRTTGDRAGVARTLTNLGMVVERESNYARARALLEEALAIFRDLGAQGDIAATLAALGIVAEFQGDYETAWPLLEQALSQFRSLRDEWGMANALGNMAITVRRHGEYGRALTLYEEALTHARAVGDRRGITRWLNGLALSLASQGEYDRAQTLLEESLALSRALCDRRGMAFSLNDLGEVACKQGAYERARTHFEESLSLLVQFGDKWLIANSYRNLAGVATEAGDEERATDLLRQSLALFQTLGDRWGTAQCLELGARVEAGRGRWAPAVQLLAGADALRRTIDTQLDPDEHAAHERLMLSVCTALGEERFAPLWSRGSALALDELIVLVASALQPEGISRTAEQTRSR